MTLQSWFDEGKVLYVIEIFVFEKRILVEYEERNLWMEVLKYLDECI